MGPPKSAMKRPVAVRRPHDLPPRRRAPVLIILIPKVEPEAFVQNIVLY